MKKPELQDLPQYKERITFLYVEHCIINREDGALTIADARGTVHVPAAVLSVLLSGPGTSISHRAVELAGDAGISIIWVGEEGVRYYAHGRPLTHSSTLLMRQAELVSNQSQRLAVARKMYQMRFPDEDVSKMTMQQLRGREGARVRASYRRASRETGVPWNGREYTPSDFEAGDPVNRALSAAHACLYGIAHSAIAALGCSPGLGFVHTGHERSFVYDIADLYKAEVTVPIAFQVASEEPQDIGGETRRRVRDAFADGHILERCVKDIRYLLSSDEKDCSSADVSVLHLWDGRNGVVLSGVSYGKAMDMGHELEDGYGAITEE